MNLIEIHEKTMERLKEFDVRTLLPALKNVSEGSLRDVMDKQNSSYYQYLVCLMDILKPKQVVELGGAMGTSALCILHTLPLDSKLCSITLEEKGQEFSFIKTNYSNLEKYIGNDLDLKSWNNAVDFSKTDILFIDAEHSKEQVLEELKLYIPLIGEGKLVIMDDIKLNDGMWEVWQSIKRPKLDVSVLHHSGFGMFIS